MEGEMTAVLGKVRKVGNESKERDAHTIPTLHSLRTLLAHKLRHLLHAFYELLSEWTLLLRLLEQQPQHYDSGNNPEYDAHLLHVWTNIEEHEDQKHCDCEEYASQDSHGQAYENKLASVFVLVLRRTRECSEEFATDNHWIIGAALEERLHLALQDQAHERLERHRRLAFDDRLTVRIIANIDFDFVHG